MEKIMNKKLLRDYLYIIIGTTLLAIAISMYFDPLNLVIGGVTGLSIVVKEVTKELYPGGIPIYVTNLVINIPLFLVAVIVKGRDFGMKSLFSVFYLSFALFFTQHLPTPTDDLLLGTIFGALIGGVGLGLVFFAKATTGGTDLAGALLQKIFKHYSIATLMMALDAMIILVGFFVFGAEKTMYAIIAVYMTARIIDAILEGVHFSKAALIISEKENEITDKIFEVLDRGVTGINGVGRYTQTHKNLLLCVVNKKEIVILKQLVKKIDPNAFIIVADVREVLGDGFIEYQQE